MPPSESLAPELQALVGTTISERYRIDALIGIGGMGAVFRAHHVGLGRDVAVKVLHPELTQDAEIAARFDREARSASRLDHPNCLQVTDSGTIDGVQGAKFLVMQLLEGEELSARLGRPLPIVQAVDFMMQILRGLEHAHEQGVVHRDLKPENVFVTRDHEGCEILKIVDFGIAKIVSGSDAQDHMTRMGIVFGTPQYMSPEQATGMEIDPRTDIYSAGIIFYEMLTGKPPFEADDPVALVRMQVTQEPAPLPEYVPLPIRSIVERMLAKDRDRRYASAQQARKALEEVLADLARAEGVPVAGGPAGSTTIPVGQPAAGAALRPLAAGAAAILGLGFLGWALSAGTLPAPAGTPEVAAAQASPPLAPAEEARNPPPPERLDEIDRLLSKKDVDAVAKILQPLMDEHPDDPQLLWRQGRWFALQKRRGAQALASFGDAIERDPRLLDDKNFYAQLMELLRRPGLEQEALNVAVRRMGHHAHPFLVELVNRRKKALSYADRHRALDELATDPGSQALVDMQLNVALDLWQAEDSLAPCKNYGEALAYVEAHPNPYFLNALRKAPMPSPEDGAKAEADDPGVCESLPARRKALIARIEAEAGGEPGPMGSNAAADNDRTGGRDRPASRKKGRPSPRRGSRKGGSSRKKKKCTGFLAPLRDKDCR